MWIYGVVLVLINQYVEKNLFLRNKNTEICLRPNYFTTLFMDAFHSSLILFTVSFKLTVET